MTLAAPAPPAGYELAHRFTVTQTRALFWMNIIGVLLFIFALGALFALLAVYGQMGSPLVLDGLPDALPVWAYLALLVSTLALHELLHGLAMLLYGITPRFGIKLTKLVLYTTTDADFARGQYLVVTLAPLAGITVLGLAGMALLPQGLALWAAIMAAMNIASSIGDMWMAAVITSFPATARFRDEADGMSIFLPVGGNNSA